MAKRPKKNAALKGHGDPVREQQQQYEPDPGGTRAERRAWARRYRQPMPAPDRANWPIDDR